MNLLEFAKHFQNLMQSLDVTILAYNLQAGTQKKPSAELLTDRPGLEKLTKYFSREISEGRSSGWGSTNVRDIYTCERIDVEGLYHLSPDCFK